MGLTIVDGPTIAAGESLSDGADCTGGSIVRVTIPQEYTPANLTFQASSDGSFYNDLYDADQAGHHGGGLGALDALDWLRQVQVRHAQGPGRAEGGLPVRHRGRNRR